MVVLWLTASLCSAATFELMPTFDVEIGNDAQIGPTSSSETGTGILLTFNAPARPVRRED